MQVCYILSCKCYSGDDSISVFYKEKDAYTAMNEELKVEKINLIESGYEVKTTQKAFGVELYVENKDIYFEWTIVESTIQ